MISRYWKLILIGSVQVVSAAFAYTIFWSYCWDHRWRYARLLDGNYTTDDRPRSNVSYTEFLWETVFILLGMSQAFLFTTAVRVTKIVRQNFRCRTNKAIDEMFAAAGCDEAYQFLNGWFQLVIALPIDISSIDNSETHYS